jgi:hypothetical protein
MLKPKSREKGELMEYAGEQRQGWNGAAGHARVASQAVLDRLFEPLADLAAARPDQLLDVGCGTESTTVASARRLVTTAACVGVDISEPMLAAARARADREGVATTFICADADLPVRAGRLRPDRVAIRRDVLPRFGRGVRERAAGRARRRRAAMIVWPRTRGHQTVAHRTAARFCGWPNGSLTRPGQFAFANDQRVRGILRDSGWSGVECRPVDIACAMPERKLVGYFTRFGTR